MPRKEIWTALGLSETAPVSDARTAFDKILGEEMTPEEKENEKKKREADEDAAKAKKDKDEKDEKEMAEVKKALGLKADAAPALMLSTIKTLAGDKTLSEAVLQDRGAVTQLTETVRQLSEKVTALEPQAKLAESLQADAKKHAKQIFFDEMVRTGRCLPTEREFQQQMYDLDEPKVRKFLSDRKPLVNLGNGNGSGSKGSNTNADLGEGENPGAKLAELAETRMREKSISYAEAVDQVRHENKELSEAAADQYRP